MPLKHPLNSSNVTKGVLLAILSAVLYGFVPTFFLPISSKNPIVGEGEGMSDLTIVFYRFFLAALFTGMFMLIKGVSFKIHWKELPTLFLLGLFRDGGALFLVAGYSFMTSGIATTLHFTYPVFVTLLMMICYKERKSKSTLFGVAMAVIGVALLCWQDNTHVQWEGVSLELLSAITFAFYLIGINHSNVKNMDNLKIVFYVLLLGSLAFLLGSCTQHEFKWITTVRQAENLFILGFFCTFITNFALVASIKYIGSTIAGILGAIEPLTAVVLGGIFFHERLSPYSVWGMLIILPAILLIIYSERPRK